VWALIETNTQMVVDITQATHPVWVRGLKLNLAPQMVILGVSHPEWVR